MRALLRRLLPAGLVDLYHRLAAMLALVWARHPSRGLTVIGITGTDGKTTTSYLVYQILKQAGVPASLITSVGAILHGSDEATAPIGLHVTTPGPFYTQRLIRLARRAGSQVIVLETTSHALAQHRVWGIRYHIAGVTNITPEHLDYHGSYEQYLKDKAKLLRDVSFSILNQDDSSFGQLLPYASGQVIAYSLRHPQADYVAEHIVMSREGTRFEVPGLGHTFSMKLIGEYNVHNALLAIAIADKLGIQPDVIASGLAEATPPPGRLERVEMGQDFTTFVDFAHTSNGLENVLKLLSQIKTARLIAVFGCAGLRDPYKRFPMGSSAGRYADVTIITAEDPRTEDLNSIMDEIARGCESEGGVRGKSYYLIPDRAQAIRYAITHLAQTGDIVVVTGKAHEASMCFGTTEYPWNEFEVVKAALAEAVVQKAEEQKAQ